MSGRQWVLLEPRTMILGVVLTRREREVTEEEWRSAAARCGYTMPELVAFSDLRTKVKGFVRHGGTAR